MKSRKKSSPRAATAIDVYIGVQMRDRRTNLGLTQEALGKKLGVSFQQVQKYENGVNRVSAARLFDICKALRVPLASMFERSPTELP
jgi:transcriptional regulator with XRE-family HTH domain